MSVAFRSKNETVTTSAANPTVTEPAGAASGDALLALAVIDSTSAILTKPTGWTDLYSGVQGAVRWLVSYIIRAGSAPSLTWTKSAGTFYYEAHVLCLNSTAALALALDAQSASGASGNATNHMPNPPAVSAVAAATMAVAGGVNWAGFSNSGAPAGYTVRTRNTSGDDAAAATKSLSAAGSEDPGVFSGSLISGVAVDYWDGFTVTFAEVMAGPPVAATLGTFDPELRAEVWFDPQVLAEGWFDYGPYDNSLIDVPAAASAVSDVPVATMIPMALMAM